MGSAFVSTAFYETECVFVLSLLLSLSRIYMVVLNSDVLVTNFKLLQSYRSCAKGNVGCLRSAEVC